MKDVGQSLAALMRVHGRLLFRTARAILHDDAEAQDAVQETYLQAWRALGRFRGESKLSTWLVRIAVNQALMRRRRNARKGNAVPVETVGLESAAEQRDPLLHSLLENRIGALPGPYRAVFMLRALEELSVAETSAALLIPEATVRTRYFRARALLRDSLARIELA